MCVIVIMTVFKYFSVSQDVSYHITPPVFSVSRYLIVLR